ncbi:GPW/gp25 family protein [bacterium]|nr:GPW/gp25 family protein [bacterium]
MTDRGERLFQPQLGCDIRGSLFENVTPNVVLIIKENIKNTLKTFEPRCIVKDVIIGGNIDRNELSATIVFSVI